MADKVKTINFIEKWDKRGRQFTWSGTPYGIFKALSENGASIHDVPIGQGFFDKCLCYANRVWMKLRGKKDFDLLSIGLVERELKKNKLVQPDAPCLMFTQYRSPYTKNAYVFLDYSVQFLIKIRGENREIMDFTPLKHNIPEKKVQKRNEIVEEWTRDCKGIFTMSRFLEQDFVERLGVPQEKVHWVGGGCNVDASKIEDSKKNGKKFLFVGKHWETKNGPLVVEAFCKLHETNPDIELYILGPGEEPECVKGKEGVHFVGFTPYEKTMQYYNLCDYYVMPSKCEAYGIAFGEALIFGLPCIAKNVFAMPEFIEDDQNGYLIQSDDVNELFESMQKLLQNGERLKKNVKERREYYLERYSWDTVAKKIIAVMEQDGYWV